MQHNKIALRITLLFLLAATYATGQQPSLRNIERYNPWQQSANPAGVYYTAADSLMEVSAGYNLSLQPLPLSDEPDKKQAYGATALGYKRLSRLQLRGGISWQQNHIEGDQWNLLVQPGYLVAAGDSLNAPRRTEQYRIHGTAAYALAPRLTAGVGGIYTATDNLDRSPDDTYTGRAYTTHLSAGLIHQGKSLRTGFSLAYLHASELLTYSSNDAQRLFVYPMGFYLPMSEIGNSYTFRSVANSWKAAFQAEWQQAEGWSWFNEVTAAHQRRNSNPSTTDNLRGWTEQTAAFHYSARLTRNRGRWTHLVRPHLAFQAAFADRILQHAPDDDLNAAQVTFATYRLASRRQAVAHLDYELARDYSPQGRSLAWQLSADWSHHREELYAHPFTYARQTNTLRGEVAFLRTFALRHADCLTLRPSLSFTTGYGVPEEVSRRPLPSEAAGNHPRSPGRITADYISRTASRPAASLQAEYRRQLNRALTAGLRLHAGVERAMTGERKEKADRQETGGYVMISLLVGM